MSCNSNGDFMPSYYYKKYKSELADQNIPPTQVSLRQHWKDYGRSNNWIGCNNCCPGEAMLPGDNPNTQEQDRTNALQAIAQAKAQAQQDRINIETRRQQLLNQQAAAIANRNASNPNSQIAMLDSKYSNSISDLERNLYGNDMQQGTDDDIRNIADRNAYLLSDPSSGLQHQVNMLSSQIASNKSIITDHQNDIASLYDYHN